MTAGIAPKQHFLLGRTLSLEEEKRKTNSPICFGKKKTTTTTTQASALSHNALASVSVAVMNKESIALFCNSATVLAALVSCAFAGKIMEKKTKFGGGNALCALVFACFLASFTRVFSFSTNATTVVFDFIWDILMPLGVTLALLNVKVSELATKSKEVLLGFSFASVGSILGTALSFALFSKSLGVGALGYKIAACLCASYIGGSLNFAATAKALELTNSAESSSLLAASMAADNMLMAVFLGILMVLPCKPPSPLAVDDEEDQRTMKVKGITEATLGTIVSLMVATGTLLLSSLLAKLASLGNFSLAITCIIAPLLGVILNSKLDFSGPPQFISRNIMLLFFACIGAGCNIFTASAVGVPLFGFIAVLLLAQLFFALLFGKAFRVPLWATLIGLNASAGGPATAFAMAASKGWNRALQPAVLAGTIGYAIGTLVGCLMSEFLRVFAPL
ncbi:DUF819 protein [Bathycoccus prasinos]|uniref:DUF819 protein n=1 Tax=Bathycoccus prasinos TaxID=41875 RepID=K8EFI0_9CHLO|nr:DUF819 protein [Bathycoccus prasinos]CCO16882.1 DUF819 protein [Bathycoccus prasinos]|mmetsp:Transcript_735/g.2321  ORF Transcript_735/g.2321 Transcript_735/m.2321 type:complete len:450 (+) Transcript_735:58-1407(+)|eukprot:XP_007513324.1 DUF819 protein [Bathycoccus prasinos]